MNILKFKSERPNCKEFLDWYFDSSTLNNNYTGSINNEYWTEDKTPYIARVNTVMLNSDGLVFNSQNVNTNNNVDSAINDFNERLNQIESQINILLRMVSEQNINSK